MDAIQAILDFLNQPLIKIGFVVVGTYLLRKWPNFVNEAAPIWTGIYSIGVTVLSLLVGGEPYNSLRLTEFVTASTTAPWWQSLLFDGLLPWLIGFGGQRAGGQTIQWAKGESKVQDRPRQTFV